MASATRVPLDRRFVTTALLLGLGYACTVSLLGWLFGKEAAGAAGAGLTALGVALVRQFETLRFREVSATEQRIVNVPALRFWPIVLLVLSTLNVQVILGGASAVALRRSGLPAVHELSGKPRLVSFIALLFCAYTIGGYIAAKGMRGIGYTHVALVAFLATLFNQLVEVVFGLPLWARSTRAIVGSFSMWILWPMAAMIGARIGFGPNMPRASTDDGAGVGTRGLSESQADRPTADPSQQPSA